MSCLSSGVYTSTSTDRLYPMTIQIRNMYGGWTPVRVISDTGNENTIMKRSVADALGLDLNQGQVMHVAGINGGAREFRKIRLPVKIGSISPLPVTIGFALKEEDLVENLLGNSDLLKSGRVVAIYDKNGVTYREKGSPSKVAGCGNYSDQQPTLNNLYEQLTTVQHANHVHMHCGCNKMARSRFAVGYY